MKVGLNFLDEAQDTKIAENVLFIVSSVITKSQAQAWLELDIQSPWKLEAQIFLGPFQFCFPRLRILAPNFEMIKIAQGHEVHLCSSFCQSAHRTQMSRILSSMLCFSILVSTSSSSSRVSKKEIIYRF